MRSADKGSSSGHTAPRAESTSTADDDDEFTVVVHEQVEKAMQRVSGRFVVAVFVATGVPAIVYLTLHDYLYAYLPTYTSVATIGAAISCRSPLFYIIQDVCRLYELRPTDGSVLARLVTIAATAVPGFAAVAFYGAMSLRVRLVYGYYLVGDIQYTRKRFLRTGLLVFLAAFNTAMQGFISWTRSQDIELLERAVSPNELFFITQCSILLLCSALFQVLQFGSSLHWSASSDLAQPVSCPAGPNKHRRQTSVDGDTRVIDAAVRPSTLLRLPTTIGLNA
jgi:hypothetical protein